MAPSASTLPNSRALTSARKWPRSPPLLELKTGKDLEIEKLATNVHMAPNGLRAENFNAILPALGTLVGGGTLDSKNISTSRWPRRSLAAQSAPWKRG